MLTKKGCKTTESDVFAAIALKIENKDGPQCQVNYSELTDMDKQILKLITNAEPLPAKQEKLQCSSHPKSQPTIKTGERLVNISLRKEVMQMRVGSLKSTLLIKKLADPSLQGIEDIHRRIIQSTGQILA